MTKPDGSHIFKMVKKIRADPELGIKTAARQVLADAGLKGEPLKTGIERLRRKYRRLRDANQLPTKPPLPAALVSAIKQVAAERPIVEDALKRRRESISQQLQDHGIEASSDPHKLREELERELHGLQVTLRSREVRFIAHRLLEAHGSEEETLQELERKVERRAQLELVLPLLRELCNLPPVED